MACSSATSAPFIAQKWFLLGKNARIVCRFSVTKFTRASLYRQLIQELMVTLRSVFYGLKAGFPALSKRVVLWKVMF